MLTVPCESCGARLALPEDVAGVPCKCARCGSVFVPPGSDVPALLTTAPAAPTPGTACSTPVATPAADNEARTDSSGIPDYPLPSANREDELSADRDWSGLISRLILYSAVTAFIGFLVFTFAGIAISGLIHRLFGP